jgi:hypothetical protein
VGRHSTFLSRENQPDLTQASRLPRTYLKHVNLIYSLTSDWTGPGAWPTGKVKNACMAFSEGLPNNSNARESGGAQSVFPKRKVRAAGPATRYRAYYAQPTRCFIVVIAVKCAIFGFFGVPR